MAQTTAERVHAGTLQRLLRSRRFFRDLAPVRFREAEAHAALVQLPAGATVLARGDLSPFAWFLISGRLQLNSGDGIERAIAAEDPDAGYPVANLRPSRFEVTTREPTRLLRLEMAFLKRIARDSGPARFLGGDQRGGGSWQSHPFATELAARERAGRLEIPALPGISARIGRALQDPDCALEDIARLISADPAIAGGLLRIANSAVFRGVAACESVQAAVVRLGVEKTRTLVTTLAARSLFSARRAWINKRLHALWRHAVEIGALSAVLAHRTPGLDNARGLLVGLLHEIGAVAVLQLADEYPDLETTPGILDAVLANRVPELSAATLASWHLPEDFISAARHQENWYYDHEGSADSADLVIIAHLHSLIRARRFRELPRIDDIPAYPKLGHEGLSARASLAVLEDAQQELSELRSMLA